MQRVVTSDLIECELGYGVCQGRKKCTYGTVSIVFQPVRCPVCFPRSILSSSASTIVTDGLLLQSVGCRAGCVLCAWWSASIVPITVKKQLDSFLRVHLDGVNTRKKRSGRPDDTLTAVCSTTILPTTRLGPEPLPYLRDTQQTPMRNVISALSHRDLLLYTTVRVIDLPQTFCCRRTGLQRGECLHLSLPTTSPILRSAPRRGRQLF